MFAKTLISNGGNKLAAARQFRAEDAKTDDGEWTYESTRQLGDRLHKAAIKSGAIEAEFARVDRAMGPAEIIGHLSDMARGDTPEQQALKRLAHVVQARDALNFYRMDKDGNPIRTEPAPAEGQPPTEQGPRGWELDPEKLIAADMDTMLELSVDGNGSKAALRDPLPAIKGLLDSRRVALETLAKILGVDKSARPDNVNNVVVLAIESLPREQQADIYKRMLTMGANGNPA